MNLAPLVLDFDGSVGVLPGATVVALSDWQETIRFGCTLGSFQRLRDFLAPRLPAAHGTVLLGSGDYHHLSWPLIERLTQAGPFQVVVFDNHPDNMRFPIGVHCGSWVHRVARLPFVSHVHVVGITSPDISLAHAWENHWRPLLRGKLTYWCMDVDVGWARRFGLGRAFRRFENPDALIDGFLATQSGDQRTYISIDKDALAPEAVQTNWDQGRLQERHLLRVIKAFSGRVIGSDITGEVSSWEYRTWWKRQLSALDGQDTASREQLAAWQKTQRELNERLLVALASSSVGV